MGAEVLEVRFSEDKWLSALADEAQVIDLNDPRVGNAWGDVGFADCSPPIPCRGRCRQAWLGNRGPTGLRRQGPRRLRRQDLTGFEKRCRSVDHYSTSRKRRGFSRSSTSICGSVTPSSSSIGTMCVRTWS